MNDALTSERDRDVIYTLRTAHQNQTQLNHMADQKANILIGLIIIPITFLLTRNQHHLSVDEVRWLSICVLVIETIALFIAILVIRPRTGWMKFKADIENIPNPLFFGFFTRYSEEQYVDFMHRNITNDYHARDLLLKEIYQIGIVLRRKYKLLNLAYLFASIGVIVALCGSIFFLVYT